MYGSEYDITMLEELKEFRGSVKVIYIKECNTLIQQRPPDKISLPNRVIRRIPISGTDSSFFRRGNLSAKGLQLGAIQDRLLVRVYRSDSCFEVCRGNWRDQIGYALVLWFMQGLERAIEEELRHPSSNSLRVKELKLQKLRLKEQIEVLRGARAH